MEGEREGRERERGREGERGYIYRVWGKGGEDKYIAVKGGQKAIYQQTGKGGKRGTEGNRTVGREGVRERGNE